MCGARAAIALERERRLIDVGVPQDALRCDRRMPLGEEPKELVRLTHRTIKGVAVDMERFHFNVAISKLMVLTNGIRSALDAGGAARGAAEALVQMLAPFAPFAAEELWREVLGHAESVHVSSLARVTTRRWPREDTVTLVVQVDGKVRDKIEVPADADEERVLELAHASEKAGRAIGDREVVKEIVRAPKLVNFVTR